MCKLCIRNVNVRRTNILSRFTSISIRKMDFHSQTKYIKEILKKFKMEESKLVTTPMVTGCKLSKNDGSLEVDHTMYRSMIGSLLYVTTSRPNIMHVVGLVAKF